MNHSKPPDALSPGQPTRWLQVEAQGSHEQAGEVIVEMPVSLSVNGATWLTLMCTPTSLEALAVGFLFNEGVIDSLEEVVSAHVCATGDVLDVWLSKAAAKPDDWRRTSGCTGGVTSVNEQPGETEQDPAPIPVDEIGRYTSQQIGALIEALFEAQDLYRSSGGVHTSALSDGERLLYTAEDIGRHNTLDKLAGLRLMHPVDAGASVLLTTGRISSEMMQKAHRLGARLVISRTSPSSLSISLARQYGITLIGYARRHRFNVYSYPERIAVS
jgi:FdhD protein